MRSILSIGAGEFPLPSVPSRYFSPADSKMTYNLLSTLSSGSVWPWRQSYEWFVALDIRWLIPAIGGAQIYLSWGIKCNALHSGRYRICAQACEPVVLFVIIICYHLWSKKDIVSGYPQPASIVCYARRLVSHIKHIYHTCRIDDLLGIRSGH